MFFSKSIRPFSSCGTVVPFDSSKHMFTVDALKPVHFVNSNKIVWTVNSNKTAHLVNSSKPACSVNSSKFVRPVDFILLVIMTFCILSILVNLCIFLIFIDPYWTHGSSQKVLWNMVCLCFHLVPAFFGILSLVFSKFWHGAWNPDQVVCDSCIFQNLFCPQNRENGPKMGQKQGFLNLLKKLVINFYRICSIIFILFAVFLHKSYIWDFFSLKYEPKYSQPIRLQDFSINHYL